MPGLCKQEVQHGYDETFLRSILGVVIGKFGNEGSGGQSYRFSSGELHPGAGQMPEIDLA